HVDDRATPSAGHSGHNRLSCKELVTQVDGHALVPILRRYFSGRMAVIARCVVYQAPDRSQLPLNVANRGAQSGYVGEVALEEERDMGCLRGETLYQLSRARPILVDESHSRAL